MALLFAPLLADCPLVAALLAEATALAVVVVVGGAGVVFFFLSLLSFPLKCGFILRNSALFSAGAGGQRMKLLIKKTYR